MRLIIAAVATTLACGSAHASPPVAVRLVPRDQLASLCDLAPERLLGCSVLRAKSCDVLVAANLPGALRRAVVAHERAHCRGYVHPKDPLDQ